MSGRRALALATLVLGVLLLPGAAPAQPPSPPLTATIFFDFDQNNPPPPNLTFDGTTPIKLKLQIKNVSGAPIITTEGFSATDFWRQLTFQLEGVGIITNADLATSHADIPFKTCHYRNGIVVSAIQVVPIEQLQDNFALEFTFDDARAHFDLTRAGRYTVTAHLSFLTYTTDAAVITDCDVEFAGKSLVSFGTDDPTGHRQQFDIVSNSLEFFIQPRDSTPPTTMVTASPAPNAAGWNNQDVTLTFTASDDSGGSGVKNITVSLFGSQNGTQTIAGASASVEITAEGITTAFYNAEDNAANKETVRSQTVRLDKAPPTVSITSPAGGATYALNQNVAASYTCTDLGSGVATCVGPVVSGKPIDTSTPGDKIFTVNATDDAGNASTGSVTYSVRTTDVTPPELTARCAPPSRNPVVAGRDSGSGVASVTLIGSRRDRQTYRILDLAGNSLDAVFDVDAHGRKTEIELLRLAYTPGRSVRAVSNRLKCEWSLDRSGRVKELEQKLELRDNDVEVHAKFNAKKNQTEIRVKRRGPDQRVTRPGLVFLLLTTSQGTVGFEF